MRTDCLGTLLLAAFWLAAPAHGELDTRLTMASAYLHRGLEQSQAALVFQASLEYQTGGWFAGVWASTVDFGRYDDRSSEVDYYAGYGTRLTTNLALEATAIRYTFQGSSPRDDDWSEIQISAHLAQRWTITGGLADHWWATGRPSHFIEATYRHPLPWQVTVDATAGYQLAERAAGVTYGYAEVGLSRRYRTLVIRAGFSAVESAARERFLQFADDHWVASITWQP